MDSTLEYRNFFDKYKKFSLLAIKLDSPLSDFIFNPIASYVMWEYGAELTKSLIKSDFSHSDFILFANKNFSIPRVLISSNKQNLSKIIDILRELKIKTCLLGFENINREKIEKELKTEDVSIDEFVSFQGIDFFAIKTL